jgi:large subunit ribosomal protein L17
MIHGKLGRKLGRTTSHRKAMLRNLVTSLLKHKKITTTVAKAKECKRFAERMIEFAKKGDLHSRREVLSYVRSNIVVRDLFNNIAPLYKERTGGYTRIIHAGLRKGDSAPMCILELVGTKEETVEKKDRKRKRKHKKETGETPVVETKADQPKDESKVEPVADETKTEPTKEEVKTEENKQPVEEKKDG